MIHAEEVRNKLELEIADKILRQNQKNDDNNPYKMSTSITNNDNELPTGTSTDNNQPTCNYFLSSAIGGISESVHSSVEPGKKGIENVSSTETKDSITVGEELEQSGYEYE